MSRLGLTSVRFPASSPLPLQRLWFRDNRRLWVRAQELCESRGGRPGLPSLIVLTVSVDVKQRFNQPHNDRAQELCESRGGRPGLPSLIVLTVSVDVKQHSTMRQSAKILTSACSQTALGACMSIKESWQDLSLPFREDPGIHSCRRSCVEICTFLCDAN